MPTQKLAVSLGLGLACLANLLSAQEQSTDRPTGAPKSIIAATESRSITFEALGLTVQDMKSVNEATGEVRGRTVDQWGREHDLSALRKAEIEARKVHPILKISKDLREAMQHQPTGTLDIVVWLDSDLDALEAELHAIRATLPTDANHAAVKAAEKAMTALAMQRVGDLTKPAAAALRMAGIPVRYVSTTAPVIFLAADAQLILELAKLSAVDTIYIEKNDARDHNSTANNTHRTTTPHASGWKGAGIDVAVLENNGIDSDNPYLNVAGWFNAAAENPDDHVQGTSGCIASQLATRLGTAPEVNLYSANATSYGDADITAAADWCVSNDRDIVNMSFGGGYSGVLQYKDRYFDYVSRTYLDSFVASAGNDGSYVGSPATAWNVIAVGAFNDNDTTSWTGDAMCSFSDYLNPASNVEKPNLAAVGQGVDTLGWGAPWTYDNYAGTSFSAPFTSGGLAIAMSRDSTAILYPTAAMAAMMATAWHNIEGSARISSLDGAGGLHVRAASLCANANRIHGVNLSAASFTSATSTGYYTYSVSLTAGQRARICIAWAAKANSAYSTDSMDADLDLRVYQGAGVAGSLKASSVSLYNNYEIVDFTPAVTGTHTLKITRYRFDGSSEDVGIAVTQLLADQGN